MRTIYNNCFLVVLLIAGLMTGCSEKEEALQPSGISISYDLPQGNQVFDQEIVNFYNLHKTYILYKFTVGDVYNVYADPGAVRVNAELPTVNDAGPAFYFLKKNCMDFYRNSFLDSTLPYRILLTAKLDSVYQDTKNNFLLDTFPTQGFSTNPIMLAFGWANDSLSKMPDANLRIVKGRLHKMFWRFMMTYKNIPIPDLYSTVARPLNVVNPYLSGHIDFSETFRNKSGTEFQRLDVQSFIDAITSSTRAQLNATLLSTTIDKNGWIKKKYDVICAYYLTKYGIDLQAIGETAIR